MWNYIPNMCNTPVTYKIHNFTLWFMISQNMVTFQCEHINVDVSSSCFFFHHFLTLFRMEIFLYIFYSNHMSINKLYSCFLSLNNASFWASREVISKIGSNWMFFLSFLFLHIFIFFSSKSEMPITKWLK